MSPHSREQNFPIFDVNAQSLQNIRRQLRQRASWTDSRLMPQMTQVVPSPVNARSLESFSDEALLSICLDCRGSGL